MLHAGDDALKEMSGSLRDGQSSPKLKHWLDTQSAAASLTCPHLKSHITLLQACNTALNLHKDTGYEVALQFLATSCLAAQFSAFQQNTLAPNSQANASPVLPPRAAMTGVSQPSVSQAAAQSLTQALMQDLSEKVCNLQLALNALAVAPPAATFRFPKFKELVQVLTEMQGKKSTWHSIIFVKERQSVHAIVAMLRNLSQLAALSFYAFTGRATNSKRPMKPYQAVPHHTLGPRSAGMKSHEQKSALLQFKQAGGMAVLVATAAAEEGLDITKCELVVCYSVVETGREMMQRRGRARRAGSEFVCLVEEPDQARLDSARVAECNARIAQLHVADRCL